MIIHFSILLVILLVSAAYEHSFRANKIRVIADGGTASDYLGSIIPWLIIFGYIAFLAGMRSSMNDTEGYKESFKSLEPSWDNVWNAIESDIKDKGFPIASNLFKMYISQDFHAWFFAFAIVESLLLSFVLRRESVSMIDACFFFFASTTYYNYFSMMRQWLAVVIVFWAAKFIKKRKFIPYLLFCLLAAQFHTSAYFMIPVYFIVSGKAWSKKQLGIVGLFAIAFVFLRPILGFLESATGDTTYGYVVETMSTGSGSSWLRIPVALVPVVLSYIYRDKIKNDVMANICTNMALVQLLVLIVASVTSGIFIGRMSVYFGIFNTILFPYLLNVAIDDKNRSWIKALYYIGYFAFYIFQMNYSDSFFYGSDILGYFN